MDIDNKLGISIIPTYNIDEDYEIALKATNEGIKLITLSDYHKGQDFKTLFSKISELRITLGTAVTNFIFNDPKDVALFFLEIYKTNNRIFLGISTGDWLVLFKENISVKGSLRKLVEGINIVKKIFNENKVNIAVYIGAQGKYLINLSKRIADGVILNLAYPEHINKALSLLGDANKDFKKFVIAQTFIDESYERALKNARKSASIIYAGLSRSAIEMYGFDEIKRNTIRNYLIKEKTEEARKILSEEDIIKTTICGNPNEVEERIIEILKMKIDALILGLPMGNERNNTLKNILSLLKELKSIS